MALPPSFLPGFLKGTATATSSSPPSKCQGSTSVGRLPRSKFDPGGIELLIVDDPQTAT